MTRSSGCTIFARLATAWVLIACVSCGIAQSQVANSDGAGKTKATVNAAGGPAKISNVFVQTDLTQALADVAGAAGVTILTDASVQGSITLELKDAPIEEALDLMLLPGGFVYKLVKPGVYLVASPDPSSPNFSRVAESQTVELNYVSSKDLKSLLPETYAKFVKFDETGRRVTVMAPSELLEQTTKAIKNLDVPPVQVLIEALVVDTDCANLKDFDLSVLAKTVSLETGSGIMTYTGDTDKVLVQMLWLAEKQQATIRANPRVIAQEGIPSEVKVGIEQYFQILSGAVGYQYSTLEAIESAVGLKITPYVAAADNKVTCVIQPEVDDVTGVGPNNLPTITRRSVQSTVCVGDGQVIAIGGLLQNMSRETRRKVPVLGDIPLIGKLFRSSTVENQQREIVIFIVPHILDENGQFKGCLLLDASRLPVTTGALNVAPAASTPARPDLNIAVSADAPQPSAHPKALATEQRARRTARNTHGPTGADITN